jgi:hypothetical protein
MWLSNSELEHPPATQINVQTNQGTPAIGSRITLIRSDGSSQVYHIDVSTGYASTSSHVVWTSGSIERIEVTWGDGHSSTHLGPWASGSVIMITDSNNRAAHEQTETSQERTHL